MANSLGYKDKITWETIQNPYVPVGMAQQIETQKICNRYITIRFMVLIELSRIKVNHQM